MSYTSLHYHVVFATKNRVRFFHDPERIHAYLGGVVRQMKGTPHAIGGIADHVHLLLFLPPEVMVSNSVGRINSIPS